ncbi:MAG: aminotransferase class III-fold pyridoxal phosphate-dependent enzyme [Candidatus Yonathbacteria bacterium]|nr:aminotransferase class III-fold pyridoxal phosphate-dependent enzyme [Candidatus Yonathbacteria bacterium]
MKKKKTVSTKKGHTLWKKAKQIIPGGNQLLSKRSEMFLPNGWPSYYSKAKGVEVWDLDGNKFIDMSIMGVGSSLLGYSDPDVNKAVKKAIDNGVVSTLNAPEEVELAEMLCKIHPWAKMVRYARSGGEALAIAIRIARAFSGKDKIAFCGYHGWSDWYLSTNLSDDKNLDGHLLPGLEPRGVPRGLKGTMFPFHYNKISELEDIVEKYGKEIGVIVLEPMKGEEPKDDFLKKVRALADKTGAVLVFDEVTIGWKMTFGGAHLLYGVNPDIAVFAKAISNGFAMATIIGTREVMQAAQTTFISSTNWTERLGPVAALATLKKMKRLNVAKKLQDVGVKVKKIWNRQAIKHGLLITIGGLSPLSNFIFKYGDRHQALKTLFIQEMLQRGFLASNMVFVSYAHTDAILNKYEKAVDEVFKILKSALDTNTVEKRLKGPVAHTGFARLN